MCKLLHQLLHQRFQQVLLNYSLYCTDLHTYSNSIDLQYDSNNYAALKRVYGIS